jgi:hypothetical protein
MQRGSGPEEIAASSGGSPVIRLKFSGGSVIQFLTSSRFQGRVSETAPFSENDDRLSAKGVLSPLTRPFLRLGETELPITGSKLGHRRRTLKSESEAAGNW